MNKTNYIIKMNIYRSYALKYQAIIFQTHKAVKLNNFLITILFACREKFHFF